jgi:hypothetical protein
MDISLRSKICFKQLLYILLLLNMLFVIPFVYSLYFERQGINSKIWQLAVYNFISIPFISIISLVYLLLKKTKGSILLLPILNLVLFLFCCFYTASIFNSGVKKESSTKENFEKEIKYELEYLQHIDSICASKDTANCRILEFEKKNTLERIRRLDSLKKQIKLKNILNKMD